RAGLSIVALRMMDMSRDFAARHYAAHRGKPFYERLLDYVTSGPVVAAICEGPGAVRALRGLIGATDPAKAGPGTIRGDFGLDVTHNLVHASDSPESAAREIALFFPE
ncbi:MAG: nucleoside-diphosphate kinase, partial [Bacillota bacterium]